MIDAKVLEGVKALIATYGRLTCGVLADRMQMPPSSMVYFLRDAVSSGVLTECNGFYDVPRPRPHPASKKSSAVSEAPIRWCEHRKVLLAFSGQGYTRTALALREARLALVEDLTTRGIRLPGVSSVAVRTTEPALVTLYRAIGDSTQWQRFVRRNGVVHPLFVPGGSVVEVINA